MSSGEADETTYRNVHWRRVGEGGASFYDTDSERWVEWRRGIDAPPVPPGWGGPPVRPRWATRWRLAPLLLIVVALIIAVVQATRPTGNAVHKEEVASAALFGKCLAQHGTAGGRPIYSAKPVTCDSPTAAVKVVRVLPPGSPLCPAATVGVELPYAGVRNPHVECLQPVGSGG